MKEQLKQKEKENLEKQPRAGGQFNVNLKGLMLS